MLLCDVIVSWLVWSRLNSVQKYPGEFHKHVFERFCQTEPRLIERTEKKSGCGCRLMPGHSYSPTRQFARYERDWLRWLVTAGWNQRKFVEAPDVPAHKPAGWRVNPEQIGIQVVVESGQQRQADWLVAFLIRQGVMKKKASETCFAFEDSHSTTGNNDEKGTGSGWILCQEFVGKRCCMRAESEPGVRSPFRFILGT